MHLLIAQTAESIWPSVVQALRANGLWVFLAICVMAGTAKHIVGMILKHKERIAMIDAGLQPDEEKPILPVGFADAHSTKNAS